MNALIIYWSGTGNTKKVAEKIHGTLKNIGINSILRSMEEAMAEDLYEYDLVFIGSPSYRWLPPSPVMEYMQEKMNYYRKQGNIKLCAPCLPGKTGVVFVTYSGPHTGASEAVPAAKYLGQFLEHIGFTLSGEWYTVGEFHRSPENSIKGRLGDIRGRPDKKDLDVIADAAKKLIRNILLN